MGPGANQNRVTCSSDSLPFPSRDTRVSRDHEKPRGISLCRRRFTLLTLCKLAAVSLAVIVPFASTWAAPVFFTFFDVGNVAGGTCNHAFNLSNNGPAGAVVNGGCTGGTSSAPINVGGLAKAGPGLTLGAEVHYNAANVLGSQSLLSSSIAGFQDTVTGFNGVRWDVDWRVIGFATAAGHAGPTDFSVRDDGITFRMDQNTVPTPLGGISSGFDPRTTSYDTVVHFEFTGLTPTTVLNIRPELTAFADFVVNFDPPGFTGSALIDASHTATIRRSTLLDKDGNPVSNPHIVSALGLNYFAVVPLPSGLSLLASAIVLMLTARRATSTLHVMYDYRECAKT